jgi:hypothetical protein
VVVIERKNWTSACSCATWACKSAKACIRSIVEEEEDDNNNDNKEEEM